RAAFRLFVMPTARFLEHHPHPEAQEESQMVTPPRTGRPLLPVAFMLVVALVATALSGCAHTSQPAATNAASTTTPGAARMVELGAQHGESFLKHSQTKAIRNMLRGVRAVFIADLTDEAVLLGMERGTGFMLRRHGKEWSDPVFVQFDETSIGYQAGVKE